MTDASARIVAISDLLRDAENARHVTQNPVWAKLWNELEQELLERLLKCGPTDDEQRWRCQASIEVGRTIRRMFETRAVTPASLEKELAHLDGSKLRPIA